jgi:4-nitrophenyl phosphatase
VNRPTGPLSHLPERTPPNMASPRKRGFIFDIDGTLALADRAGHQYQALPGASQVIARLTRAGVPVAAFTNGTLRTPSEYRDMLAGIGIELPPGRVMTPASVAAEYFARLGFRRVLVLGIDGTINPLEEAGIEVVRPRANLDDVQAVLVGWFPGFGLGDLDAACRAAWAGAPLFAVSTAPYFASRGGRIIGISGAIVAMIRSVTGRRAIVLGKPSNHAISIACACLGVRRSDTVVVGDDSALEIAMARRAGALAVGVLTGVSQRDAFLALPSTKAAHLVLDSVADLLATDLMPV